jgi:hypothetical protein
VKLSRPARTIGAAPRRLLGGYGPLLALAVAFLLVVTLVPTIAREENVVAGSETGATGTATDLGGTTVPGVGTGAPTLPGAPTKPGATANTTATGTAKTATAGPCSDRRIQVVGDPYSPPCMAWPAGRDNGGATYRGVS